MKRNDNEHFIRTTSSHDTMGYDFIAGSSNESVVEEKVAHLSLQLNQIIIKPYLQQALDYLKSSKFDAINAYNRLSDQIGNEVRIISRSMEELTGKLNECQEVINRTQEIIRSKYSNATEEEIANGTLNLEYEYNVIAEHYELSLQISQEISKYKSRIENLLSTQGLLDNSSVPAVNRIQLEVENLELLIHNLDSTDYAEALAKKQGRKNIKKVERQPAITGRQEALSDYAQQLSANAVNNLQQAKQGPNLDSMNRYEDPNGLSINRNKYPYKQELQKEYKAMSKKDAKRAAREQARNQGFNPYQQPRYGNAEPAYDQYPYQIYGEQPMNSNGNVNNDLYLSRDEMKMQKKLYKQQKKLQKMQLRNDAPISPENVTYNQPENQSVNNQPVQQQAPIQQQTPVQQQQTTPMQQQGRFANVEEEEAMIARAKAELDNYSEYLNREIEQQRAFSNNRSNTFSPQGKSVRVIR